MYVNNSIYILRPHCLRANVGFEKDIVLNIAF